MDKFKKIQMAKGNPGALSFLIGIEDSDSEIINKLEKCPSIRGTNLWVLYSDLCGKDMNKVKELCIKCPDSVLEDACNRQDYSGIDLVSEYI